MVIDTDAHYPSSDILLVLPTSQTQPDKSWEPPGLQVGLVKCK